MLKPTLVSIVAVDGTNEDALLALAAGAARGLEPRLGSAIVASALERDVDIASADRVQETGQAGIVASVAGHTVVVGNANLFTHLGLSIATLGDWPNRLRERGQHVLFVAVDGRAAGLLGLVGAGA